MPVGRWWGLWLWCRSTHVIGATVTAAAFLAGVRVTRWLWPGIVPPDLFDPVLVPILLVLVASVSLQTASPHLDLRNPRATRARLGVSVWHTAVGSAAIWFGTDPTTPWTLPQALRCYLLSLGLLLTVAVVSGPTAARACVALRALPAFVLLPAADSRWALLWWEFLDGQNIASWAGSLAVWATGLAANALWGVGSRRATGA